MPKRLVFVYLAVALATFSGRSALAASTSTVTGNLLVNPGFETAFGKNQWTYGPGIQGQGIAARVQTWKNSGSWSLKLTPNSTNETEWFPYDYAVVQNLDLKKYIGTPLFYAG